MLKASLCLATVLAALTVGINDCHGARLAGPALHHGHHQHRRLKGNVTATGRVNVHPPFRLFQALSKKYEIREPSAEIGTDATIVVAAFSAPELSEEASNGKDNADTTDEDGEGDTDDLDGENFVAVRKRKPIPQCTPRPKRMPRTPRAVDDEDLSEQASVESPSAAAATSPDSQVSSDSGSGPSMPLSSGSTAASAGNASSSSSVTGPMPTAIVQVMPSPSAIVVPSPQAPGANSSALTPTPSTPAAHASNFSSSPSVSSVNSNASGVLSPDSDVTTGFTSQLGGLSSSNSVNNISPTNDTSSSQVADVPPSSSSQPSSELLSSKPSTPISNALCIPMSVEGDATYCVPPSDDLKLSCSGPVSTQTSSSSPLRSFDSNRICPRKGDTAIGACRPGLRSFNPTSNSCIAPEDSRCIAIHTDVWGCAFSFSTPSKAGSAASISGNKGSTMDSQGSATLATSSSVTTTNFQTQNDDRDGSESQPIVLVVAAIVACVLAVLTVAKRNKQRTQQNGSEGNEAEISQEQDTTDFSYYPKTPELSKATEDIHTFT